MLRPPPPVAITSRRSTINFNKNGCSSPSRAVSRPSRLRSAYSACLTDLDPACHGGPPLPRLLRLMA